MRSILTEIEGELRRTAKTEEPVAPDLSGLDVDLPNTQIEIYLLLDDSFPKH